PSGENCGASSGHAPENDAMRGVDQCPSTRCDSMMVPPPAPLRVNSSVLPSGLKVGDSSLAGPEITPGAKIRGAASTGSVAAVAPPAKATPATSASQACERNEAGMSMLRNRMEDVGVSSRA